MLSLTLAASSYALTPDTSYGFAGTSAVADPPTKEKLQFVDSVVRHDGSMAILLTAAGNKRFAIWSVTADGQPDLRFGPGGWRIGAFSNTRTTRPLAIASYPDGRIAVLGRRHDKRALSAVVVRFTLDAGIDLDFARASGSKSATALRIPVRAREVYAGDMVVDAASRLVVSYSVDRKFLAAARINPDGRPDKRYGRLHGRQYNSIDFSKYYGIDPESIALMPDGGVAIGGWVMSDYCDDPDQCPAGGWSNWDPLVARLTARGFVVRSFGGRKHAPRGVRYLNTDFDSHGLGLSARPDGSIIVALDSTFSFHKPGTKNEGDQAYSTVVRRVLPNGNFDTAPGDRKEEGLHDPSYPTATGWDNDLFRRGFSVSPAGAIAVCGQARRTIPKDPGPFEYDHPGFIQVIDATSAADESISAANLLWTADTENAIEDCAWQSEGKLLTVDLNETLTVSRYHP